MAQYKDWSDKELDQARTFIQKEQNRRMDIKRKRINDGLKAAMADMGKVFYNHIGDIHDVKIFKEYEDNIYEERTLVRVKANFCFFIPLRKQARR